MTEVWYAAHRKMKPDQRETHERRNVDTSQIKYGDTLPYGLQEVLRGRIRGDGHAMQ